MVICVSANSMEIRRCVSYAVAGSDSMDSLSPAIYDPDLPSHATEPLLSLLSVQLVIVIQRLHNAPLS